MATGDRGFPYMPARDQLAGRGGKSVLWVVIHTMETGEGLNTAEAVGRYFQNPPRVGSSHYGVDADSIVQYVLERNQAAGAAGANRQGIHIEHAGRAAQTAAQWGDDYSERMLKRSAGLCAAICRDYGIPPVWLSAEELKAGKRGVTGHATVTRAFGGTHTDPGPNFPARHYLEMVKAAMGGSVEQQTVKIIVNGTDQSSVIRCEVRDGNSWVDLSDWCAFADYPPPVWDPDTRTVTMSTKKTNEPQS